MVKYKDLESGKVLQYLIDRFNKDRTPDKFYSVLRCFRDSYVWIPCTLSSISDADIEKFSNANVGDTIVSSDEIRLKPDILRSGDEYFFPVFSNPDQMGDYGKNFSKIEKHSFEAMGMALAHKETMGIVVDAFTNPLVIDKGLFDMIEKLPSEIES